MSNAAILRSLVAPGKTLIGMGAYDALTARMVEQAGYDVIYLGGFAAAASMLGEPDLGVLTLPEMADHIARVRAVTTRPIIADADNGHGNALAVARTIARFEAAGASGVHMEDQVLPKKCGHVAGKVLVPVSDMVNKLKAAQAARVDKDFFIIARTDDIAVGGIDSAMERIKRYADAGADALFLDAPETMEQLERIGRELSGLGKPLVFNAASTGKTPSLTVEQVQALGFSIVLYPIEPLLAAMHAARRVMQAIRTTGDLAPLRAGMASFSEIKTALGFDEAEKFDMTYPVGR